MITTIEVTLKLTVNHPDSAGLDENSVKALINEGMNNMADNIENLVTISDEQAESINIEVSKLKENGKIQAVAFYGTDVVPWGRA